MSALTLVSFHACPFVQRAAILLQEQGRDYDIVYIDLQDRPDWFRRISPSGKVPVLKVGETALFESAVILEYLDETTDQRRLLASEPLERARQRMWIAYISNIMSKAWNLQATNDEATARELVLQIRAHLEELEAQLPDAGPYWGKDSYTLVDVAIAPILQRLTWAETLEPSLGVFEGLARIGVWRDALLDRPSTQAAIVADLEQRSGRMLHRLGSWVARGYREAQE